MTLAFKLALTPIQPTTPWQRTYCLEIVFPQVSSDLQIERNLENENLTAITLLQPIYFQFTAQFVLITLSDL